MNFVLFHQVSYNSILKELSYIYFSSRFIRKRHLVQKRYSKRYSGLTSEASQKEQEQEREKDVRAALEERMSYVKYIDVIAVQYYNKNKR